VAPTKRTTTKRLDTASAVASPGKGDATEKAAVEKAAMPHRVYWLTLLGLTGLLVGLCVVLFVPFLPALTWSIALAVIAWPLHRWISSRMERPRLAAFLSTAAVVLLLLVPSAWMLMQVARETTAAAAQVQADGGAALRAELYEWSVVRNTAAWARQAGIDIETEARNLIGAYAQNVMNLARGSMMAGVQMLVAVFLLYYFFADRTQFIEGIRGLLPMSRDEEDEVFRNASDSIHANLWATFVTSVIDCTTGGLLFWAVGVPSPFLWTAVMFVLSLLPILGAGMVWVPVMISMAMSGQWGAAAAIGVWGAATFTLVDNLLYVRLAGKRMRMHPALTLLAFLGGVVVFGAAGMVLGPAILAVTIAFLQVWKRRIRQASVAA